MKVDFKKKYDFYKCKQKPMIVNIPKLKYITIKGEGNPNESVDFQRSIEALYKFSYTLKMLPKKGNQPVGYYDYVVAPLEGVWDTKSKTKFTGDKDDLEYKLMILQPEFLTIELFTEIKNIILSNKKSKETKDYINKLTYEEIEEGECIQILHIGPYENEPETLTSLYGYLKENDLDYIPCSHHEIYLSDARRTSPDKLKTIIRYKVK